MQGTDSGRRALGVSPTHEAPRCTWGRGVVSMGELWMLCVVADAVICARSPFGNDLLYEGPGSVAGGMVSPLLEGLS